MRWMSETGGYELGCNEGGWISIPNDRPNGWENRWVTRESAASRLAEAIEQWLDTGMNRDGTSHEVYMHLSCIYCASTAPQTKPSSSLCKP